MTMMAQIGRNDAVLATLVAGLEREFGRGAGAALASRFIAAEESDFIWEARVHERWLGIYEAVDGDPDDDLDRVAVISRIGRNWTMATLIVDGEGRVAGLIGRRDFAARKRAEAAFASARSRRLRGLDAAISGGGIDASRLRSSLFAPPVSRPPNGDGMTGAACRRARWTRVQANGGQVRKGWGA